MKNEKGILSNTDGLPKTSERITDKSFNHFIGKLGTRLSGHVSREARHQGSFGSTFFFNVLQNNNSKSMTIVEQVRYFLTTRDLMSFKITILNL